MNFVKPILHYAKTQPATRALIDGNRTLTYRELGEAITRMAGHLRALGVRPGDRVGVCLKDTGEHVVVLLAIGYLGAAGAPLDWRARSAENAHVAQALDTRMILTEADTTIAAPCPIVAIDDAWRRAARDAPPVHDVPEEPGAAFVITATSGTTGLPRFTLLTHLASLMRAVDFRVGPESGPRRCLCAFPLYFAAGRIIALNELYRGSTVVLGPALFSAAELVELIGSSGANILYCVPQVVRELIKIAPTHGMVLPGLDALVTAGAPIGAADKREAAKRLTPNLFEIFSTAGTGTISIFRPEDIASRADCAGQVTPLAEAQIVDDNDKPVAAGTIGRLRVRGPKLGLPLQLAGSDAADDFRAGWYYPGDIGALDESLYLYVMGRTSDVILRRGAKIFPAEIEAVLLEHPGAAEAAVVGRRGASGEDAVIALVVARAAIDPAELLAHCRARLTAYKIPQEIRVVDSLPKNTAGKVNRAALAALAL
jgi:long-chain acyl-CoA synthetase